MRRVAAIGFLVLVLTSCTSKEATPVTSGFACEVAIRYDEATYRGTFEMYDETKAILTLSDPPSVSGLTMTLLNEQLIVSYAGMELKFTDTRIPAGAAVSLLGKVFRQAAGQMENQPSCELQGCVDGIVYTLTFDSASGLPTLLSVPSYALGVTFVNCRTVG